MSSDPVLIFFDSFRAFDRIPTHFEQEFYQSEESSVSSLPSLCPVEEALFFEELSDRNYKFNRRQSGKLFNQYKPAE